MVSVLTTTKPIITQKSGGISLRFLFVLQFGTYVFHRKLVLSIETRAFCRPPPVPPLLRGDTERKGVWGKQIIDNRVSPKLIILTNRVS